MRRKALLLLRGRGRGSSSSSSYGENALLRLGTSSAGCRARPCLRLRASLVEAWGISGTSAWAAAAEERGAAAVEEEVGAETKRERENCFFSF